MTSSLDRNSLALEKVLRRFESRVRAIGGRFGLSSVELDELFQEIRIRLWKALEDPGRIESLSASYVHRTATTAALDMIRRNRGDDMRVPLDANLPDPGPANPDRQMEGRETAQRIEGALSRLDDRRRPVVRMYLAGYGHKEIAGLLGWTNGSTRNLLYRGLADLRAELAPRDE